MWDIILSTLLALCTARLGYLGMRVTLHPPQSSHEKTSYKVAFAIVGLISIAIIIWQGIRTKQSQEEINHSQEEFRKSQSALRTIIEEERNDARSARDELREVRSHMDKLRNDLAIESARREQAQKDMALIVQKASAETRTGVAQDLRKSPINVNVPVTKEPIKLAANILQQPAGDDPPYETKVLVTVNQMVTPVRLVVQCNSDILAADGSLLGVGASMSGGWGGRLGARAIGIGILSPAWTPSTPMVITIKSNHKSLGCNFMLQ